MTYQSRWMNEELKSFRATARRFLKEEFLPHQARWQQQCHPDAEAWTQAGAAGLLLTDVPEEYGGGGGTIAHQAVIVEELAQAGVHFGFTIQSVVAHYILAYGNEMQKQKWLSRMARGELVGAIAMTEADAGSDLQAIKTTALSDGSDYVINGSKTFITNGWHAGIIVLAVKTDSTAAGTFSDTRPDIRSTRLARTHRIHARYSSMMFAFQRGIFLVHAKARDSRK
jgi:acyl-CoA dehydrogenase